MVLAVDQTPEAMALTPYSTRSLQPVAEEVAGLVRTVVLVAAGATTIPPVGLETLRLFSHHKEITVVVIAVPVMEPVVEVAVLLLLVNQLAL